MICKLRNLALLASAVLALSGLAAPVASGHTPARFTSEQPLTTITGVQDGPYQITATGLTIECAIAEMRGTAEGTSFEEIEIIPTLTNCKAFGFAEAKITGFGHYGEKETCHLVLRASGTGDLVCPPGVGVTLTAGTCAVHMPAQSGVKSFSFAKTKREGKDALTVSANLDNLHGVHTDSFLCPFEGGGTFTNTKASGTGLLWGETQSGEAVGITWDATSP